MSERHKNKNYYGISRHFGDISYQRWTSRKGQSFPPKTRRQSEKKIGTSEASTIGRSTARGRVGAPAAVAFTAPMGARMKHRRTPERRRKDTKSNAKRLAKATNKRAITDMFDRRSKRHKKN